MAEDFISIANELVDLADKKRTSKEYDNERFLALAQKVLNQKEGKSKDEFKTLLGNNGKLMGQTIRALKDSGLYSEKTGKKNKKKKKPQKPKEEPKPAPEANLSAENYSPLDAAWMEHQPTINLMTIGHVANGKSTTMRALSSQVTMRHTDELKGNMTIRLGYTSFKIFKVPGKPSPQCYVPLPSSTETYTDPETGVEAKLIRHFSFLDNPGHQVYMRTMLVGASVADGALLIIAANAQKCPEKQTEEHLIATSMLGNTNVVVAQNKIDLVEEHVASQQYEEIVNFMRRSGMGNAPIVPMCAQSKINIDALCAHLVERISIPQRNLNVPPRLQVVRSFDVNKPGPINKPTDFKGGVAGCVLMQGVLKVGMELEIRPGLVTREGVVPIIVRVERLSLGEKSVQMVAPGCNVGVGLNVDPSLTKKDKLVGQVLGAIGTLPPVYKECVIEYNLLRNVIGSDGRAKVQRKLLMGDNLNIAIGSCTVGATVTAVDCPILFQDGTRDEEYSSKKSRQGTVKLLLKYPVCYDLWTNLIITKEINNSWRLIGCGKIRMVKKETQLQIKDTKIV